MAPVLESLANAGPALTRSLSLLRHLSRSPRRHITKWVRGDYANLTMVIDLTLSRLDAVVLHRHPVGGQPDRAGAAVGPHHRPDAQPRTPPGNPLGRSVPLGSGALTCASTGES